MLHGVRALGGPELHRLELPFVGLPALPEWGGRMIEDDDSGDGIVTGPRKPLVPPGTYKMMLVDYATITLAHGKAKKLVLRFRITDMGDFLGIELPRYYNVDLEGKPRLRGKFKVGWGSSFMRDYATALGSLPKRMNRIPMGAFDGVEVRGLVRTVTSGWAYRKGDTGHALPQPLYYSVVERLLPPAVALPPRPTPVLTPTCKPMGKA